MYLFIKWSCPDQLQWATPQIQNTALTIWRHTKVDRAVYVNQSSEFQRRRIFICRMSFGWWSTDDERGTDGGILFAQIECSLAR